MLVKDVLEIALDLSPNNLKEDWELLESDGWCLELGSLKQEERIGAIDRFNHIITLEKDFLSWLDVLYKKGSVDDWSDYFDLLINIFTHEVAHAMVFMDQFENCLKEPNPKKAIINLKKEIQTQTEEEEHNSIWKSQVEKYTSQQAYTFDIEADLTEEMLETYSKLERFLR